MLSGEADTGIASAAAAGSYPVLHSAYGAVDLLFVGRFGSTAGLSAVSTGSQVLNLVTFVVVQFAMGRCEENIEKSLKIIQ